MLEKILQAREDRAEIQRKLIRKYKNSLISFTLNIPGRLKDSPTYRKIHKTGMLLILDSLKSIGVPLLHREERYRETGPEGFVIVNMDPMELKKLTIKIEEENHLGRVLDIDVFSSDGEQISRLNLNAPPRKCLLCNGEAKKCMWEKNHSYEDLVNKINQLASEYFNNGM